jgi:hypothetical protein
VDGLATGLALISFSFALQAKQNTSSWFCTIFFFGAAISNRSQFFLILPFLTLCVRSATGQTSLKIKLITALAVLSTALVLIPSLWLEPIRIMKSIVGNATRGGNSFSAFSTSQVMIKSYFGVLAAPCVTIAITRKLPSKQLCWGYLFTWLVFTFAFGRAEPFPDRYLAPLGVATLIFAVVALQSKMIWKQSYPTSRPIVAICFIVISAVGFKSLECLPAASDSKDFRRIRDAISAFDSGAAFLPRAAALVFAEYIPENGFDDLAKACENAMANRSNFSENIGTRLPNLIIGDALHYNFVEDELACVGRAIALKYSKKRVSQNKQIRWYDSLRFGLPTEITAWEEFQKYEGKKLFFSFGTNVPTCATCELLRYHDGWLIVDSLSAAK